MFKGRMFTLAIVMVVMLGSVGVFNVPLAEAQEPPDGGFQLPDSTNGEDEVDTSRGAPPPEGTDLQNPARTLITDPAEFSWECNQKVVSRLFVDMEIRITDGGGASINVRELPDTSADRIVRFDEGVVGIVTEGPLCNNFVWFQIEFEDGTTGWVAEGGDKYYYIEPVELDGEEIISNNALIIGNEDLEDGFCPFEKLSGGDLSPVGVAVCFEQTISYFPGEAAASIDTLLNLSSWAILTEEGCQAPMPELVLLGSYVFLLGDLDRSAELSFLDSATYAQCAVESMENYEGLAELLD